MDLYVYSRIRFCGLYIKNSRTPLIRKSVIQVGNNPDRLDHSDKFVENSPKLSCLEIIGRVFWLIELQIRRGRKT